LCFTSKTLTLRVACPQLSYRLIPTNSDMNLKIRYLKRPFNVAIKLFILAFREVVIKYAVNSYNHLDYGYLMVQHKMLRDSLSPISVDYGVDEFETIEAK